MPALSVQPPFPVFADTDGQPLEDGYILIGVVNLDPQGNPLAVYWDDALTIPAPQPIRTTGGYPSRSGTPAALYAATDYSIRVLNKNGSVVYSSPTPTDGDVFASQIVGQIPLSQTDFTSSGVGAVTRTGQEKLNRMWFDVLDYGAVADCDFDGTRIDNPLQQATDNTAAFQAAINAAWTASQTGGTEDYGGTVYIPPGQYRVNSEVLVWPSIKVMGGGMYSTKIFTPTTFTGRGALVTDASTAPYSNVPGFPTTISDLAVLAVSGGSPGGGGIYMNKNGCFVHNVWVAGFLNGIVINNTDCFLYDFASELNTYGLVVLQPTCTVTNGVLFGNATAMYVQNIIRMQATAGGASTITFPATTLDPTGAPVTQVNNAFNGWLVTIVSGTGAGQQRKITGYVGSTRVATVASAWSTPPDNTSVFTLDVDNGSVTVSDVRVSPSTQVGFYIYRSRRVQLSNCMAVGNDSTFVSGALRIEESLDVTATNFRTSCGVFQGDASATRDGIRIIGSTLVNLSSGVAAFWRNGVVVDGCQNVTIDGFQSNSNTLRGLLVNGGSQIAVNGGTFSNNGTSGGANDCGIETVNSAADAVHSIMGVQCDGLGANTQNYGVIATLAGTGRTFIGGGTSAINNVTAPYLLTDSAGGGLLFTDGSFPSNRAVPTVASAATITIPPWAVGNGVVIVSGTTGITSIAATGYDGARVTLIFSGALTMTDGSNLRLAGNFTTTTDDTITLVCDGTNWYEVARSAN